MEIIDFNKEMIEQAYRLIREDYLEEKAIVTVLPDEPKLPPLKLLAENGLSVAAVEAGKLLGFLGAYGPWRPVFCTSDVCGVFSPLHAHAVQKENRVKIWRRLYQAAGEKWAAAGAQSHAITLYTHDREAQEALYMYGFGVRCMDLIRPMMEIGVGSDWVCYELPDARKKELTPLRRELALHLAKSPCFMEHDPKRLEKWLREKEATDVRTFVAEHDGRILAYIEAAAEGENFACDGPGTMNICGAYCLPEFRGTGAAQAVLEKMISTFREEGFSRLGVDCESFNPTAFVFWRKYFDAYTYSVVRRIDENAVS